MGFLPIGFTYMGFLPIGFTYMGFMLSLSPAGMMGAIQQPTPMPTN